MNENNLPESVIDFLNYLETIKNKSEGTINAYKSDLSIFFRFMLVKRNTEGRIDKNVNIENIDITKIDDDFLRSIKLKDLYSFMSYLEKKKKSCGDYARARKVATLKSYFKYIHKKAKIVEENIAEELESPDIKKRNPIYLTLEQSEHLLNSLDKKDKCYKRDYCILTLFLNCGMRLSELCGIRLDRIRENTLTVIGKGDKERDIPLNEMCLSAINEYILVRDDNKVSEENKKYLFLSRLHIPFGTRSIENLVKKHLKNAKLTDQNYTVHKLRHTSATLMYKYGNVDIRSLQKILGHENISTTQIYTHVDNKTLQTAVENNPLNKKMRKNKNIK